MHGFLRESPPFAGGHVHTARGGDVVVHERHETRQDGRDGPHRVPGLRVKVTHAEAQAHVRIEPARGGDHHNSGRLEGILLRKHDLSMVVPALVVRPLGPLQDVMPV
eukprot:1181063-Prorocentrum_minimum.AAC.1